MNIFVVVKFKIFQPGEFLFVAKSKKAAVKHLSLLYPKLWIDKPNDGFRPEKDSEWFIQVNEDKIVE